MAQASVRLPGTSFAVRLAAAEPGGNYAVAISREELIVETARVFGFDRTGPDLKEEIGLQITALLRDRQIVADGSVLRTASSAAA
jgi:hypothetical protein